MSNAPLFKDAGDPASDTLHSKCIATKQRKDAGDDFHKTLWVFCGDYNLSAEID